MRKIANSERLFVVRRTNSDRTIVLNSLKDISFRKKFVKIALEQLRLWPGYCYKLLLRIRNERKIKNARIVCVKVS